MKRNELLDGALAAITIRPASGMGRWFVCYVDNAIKCLPIEHKGKVEIVFGTYTAQEIGIGLTSKQWDTLEYKMLRFFEQKGMIDL